MKKGKRRSELKRIAARVKRLSRQQVPQMSGEEQLRNQVRRHLLREGRFGIGDDVVEAIEKVIDSHVIEMEAEIFRRHMAEDIELGELEAELAGLAAQYGENEHRQDTAIGRLDYQQTAALRGVEDRDTPMPAGPAGVEEEGYQHGKVGELAGRGLWTRIVLYVVLFMAMVADLVTFRQVVERVVNDTAVFPLVLALTVTTTYIAHKAGEAFKAAKEARRNIRRAVSAWALSATWLAMGIGAFVFRLLAPAPVGAGAVDSYVSGGATASAADGSPVLSAVLLLLLYVLTGAVAVSAGLQRPRPEIGQYKRVDRKLRRVGPRLAALRRDVAEVAALRNQLAELREGRRAQYAVEVGRCQAAAQRVKAEASMLTRRLRAGELSWLQRVVGTRATVVGDPPVTDTVTTVVDDPPVTETVTTVVDDPPDTDTDTDTDTGRAVPPDDAADDRPTDAGYAGRQRSTDTATHDQDAPDDGPGAVAVA